MALGVDHSCEGPVELDLHLDERLLALHRDVLDLGHVRAVPAALPYLQGSGKEEGVSSGKMILLLYFNAFWGTMQ